MPEDNKSLLEQLTERRDRLRDEIADAVEKRASERAEFEQRTADEDEAKRPTDEERQTFADAEKAFGEDHDARMAEYRSLRQRLAEQEIVEERREAAARASRGEVRVTSEPLTYRRDNAHEISYWRDLAGIQVPAIRAKVRDPEGALDRLQRHAAEMNVVLPERQKRREQRAQVEIDRAEREFRGSFITGVDKRGLEESPFERRVTPSRTDGQGGYFIPPLWLTDEFIPALRAGRIAAGRCRQMELPEGTDSINIPKLRVTTQVGPQTDNAPVASQDITDTSVQCGVKTFAGQADIAMQLLEQSPGHIIDQVITEDLIADYNRLIDRQVISGGGGAGRLGEVTGIYPSNNWGAQALVTDGSTAARSGPAFNQTMGAMMSRLATNRFSIQDVDFLLHPRRWYWFSTALDGASGTVGRPVVGADRFGPFNVSGLTDRSENAEGLVGRTQFGPHGIYIDANVPVNDASDSGSNQDVAIAAKWDDLWLFESPLRTRVLTEVLSGNLEIRFQCYSYGAFLVRYGESIVIAAGTGLAAPVGAFDGNMAF